MDALVRKVIASRLCWSCLCGLLRSQGIASTVGQSSSWWQGGERSKPFKLLKVSCNSNCGACLCGSSCWRWRDYRIYSSSRQKKQGGEQRYPLPWFNDFTSSLVVKAQGAVPLRKLFALSVMWVFPCLDEHFAGCVLFCFYISARETKKVDFF